MGVYIKGMDMPKTCRDCGYCWVRKDMKNCEAKYGLPISNDRWDMERASFCPLTEVPEPHGRLIDADALADDLEADGKEFGDEMKLNCASWLRSNATPTVIERSE